jgi:hypothetical protein
MADRFPLIVNAISKKIEELVSGDNLDLTGNGIVINGNVGISGQYLKSTGGGLIWDNPGDVYLTVAQSISNKSFTACSLSGTANTISNISNSSLVNSTITVNGSTVALGGSITVPDNNTTYSISAVDGGSATEKIIRLTSGGSGAGVTDDITLVSGDNVSLSRTNDVITINSSFTDTDTITTVRSAVGGTAVSGDIAIAATGSSTVSQTGNTITINSTFTDTITRLKIGSSGTLSPGDYTLLTGGASTLSQTVAGDGSTQVTISSSDTVTRLRGSTSGTFTSGDITISGSGAATVSQSGSTITVSATDTNTITRVRGTNSGTLVSGDITLVASGATTISQNGNTIEISSINTDTGASFTAGAGINIASAQISFKNSSNFTGNRLLKWDSGNAQLVNSIISDDGSTVTINGDLLVTGTNTIINTTTLSVADNIVELRRGDNLVGSDGGIQVNRTTNSSGGVLTFSQLQWFESGGFWRVYDGSISNRIVTETETQILTNKTLTSPTLTTPSLGVATATSINGVSIVSSSNASFEIASTKTVKINNTLTFNGTDNSTINFGGGGGAGATVAYTSNTLATFATTTSTQLRGVVSDSTGTGVLVFSASPQFSTAINTNSTSFSLLNTTATSISAFGAAQAIGIGSNTGTTTINNTLSIANNFTANTNSGNTFTVNGTANFANADITIRGGGSAPFKIGRGGGEVPSNTRVGYNCLENNASGSQNTCMGYESGLAITAGASNTGLGYRTLRSCATGFNNIAIGKDSSITLQGGDGNISIGTSSLESNIDGNYNVCIGHFAGFGLLGSGNVLIGAAPDENSTNATYVPPSATGSNQLVIASGTGVWVRGDSSFNVTLPNNLRVNGNAVIDGSLTVNGTVTSINSNSISIDDKNIELAAVVSTTFNATVQNGQANISGITPTTGLIPGMTITSLTGGITVASGTYIVSITGNTAVLSNPVSGSTGSATFEATGPTDLGADGGGLILKGTTDKSIIYDHSRTDKYWVISENLELATGKKFVIGNQLALSLTTLGSTVVNSSLTSVGTLTSLSVDGATNLGGRVVEKTINEFTTSLAPSSNTLTINVGASNTVLGKPTTSAINTWAFTGVSLSNGQSITVTLILEGNTAATYGDACTVDGNIIANGVRWSGGSPPLSTTNTDILTFVIVRDSGGNVRVFGQGNTDFS